MSEFEFIAGLQSRSRLRQPVELGIGDDAAVLHHPAAVREVVTTDMLMEGVDFLPETASAALMGRKSLAVNLSDIAAMGARPTAVFVSVAFPRQRGRSFADEFMAGVFELAEEFGVTVAGGDTNTWNGPLVCSVTAIGEPWKLRPILRSGGRPGDVLWVTGACGGSLAGRHLTFSPRIREVERLLRLVEPTAMIDVSDGLAADLGHLLDASGVGAIVDAASIPIHPDVALSPNQQTPLQRALGDGEDFELIFTLSPADSELLPRAWCDFTPVTRIGVLTAERTALLRMPEGSLQSFSRSGWMHSFES